MQMKNSTFILKNDLKTRNRGKKALNPLKSVNQKLTAKMLDTWDAPLFQVGIRQVAILTTIPG